MLIICSTFFEFLNNNKIRYCHWKSNSHLDKALEGKTDLDLLIHEEDKLKFTYALTKFGFKQLFSPPEKQFPGLSDYLGFDKETGSFIHLHVHYKLILGQKYVKNHHLPLELLFFNNLQLSDNNIYVPKPELELLILIIRYCMKFDIISILYFLKRRKLYSNDIYNEFRLLINNINKDGFHRIVGESKLPINPEKLERFITAFQNNTLNMKNVLNFRKFIFLSLKSFKRRSGFVYNLSFIKMNLQKFPYLSRLFNSRKKTFADKGKIFALVGADGSGKSTLIKDLNKWLKWKIETKKIYLGIPKQKRLSYLSKLIKIFNIIGNRINNKQTSILMKIIRNHISSIRWIYIAKQRYRIVSKARLFCNAGGLVISDRYPLSHFNSMDIPMDGPRIRKETMPVLIKKAIREEEYYSKIKQPNRIFVLNTDIKELRKRKSDLEISEHIKKANAVNQMQESDNICIINGNSSYNEVLLDIKTKIWESI